MNERLRRSDGEPDATFGAARAQDLAAADGLHTGAEPMGAFAVDHRGLVGAFHDSSLAGKKLCIRALAHPAVKANRAQVVSQFEV